MQSTQNLDALFDEHKCLIKNVIWRNRPLLAALRVESEDAAQQLAIAMISAIRRYDPDREVPMAAYISISLQYEILNIKRRHKPHGMTGVRQDTRLDYVYLDGILSDANLAGLSSNDDHAAVELSELLEGLSELESEVVDLSIRGYRARSKAHAAALERVRRKYAGLYSAAY